jgi:hypothetical protein
MRYHQLLLEYDHSRTQQRYEKALYERLKKDRSFQTTWAQMVNRWSDERRHNKELKFEFLVTNFAIHKFELEADPTANKEYMPWIITRYLNGGIALYEDRFRVEEALETFHAAKTSGWFKRNPDYAKFADIGQIRSLFELERFVDQINPTELVSNNGADKALEQELIQKGEAKIAYNDDQYKIVEISSVRAAVFFGRNTKWCTAAKTGNQASHYLGLGPLFVVLDKANNRRWQFHFRTAQFMDERDVPITFGPDFPQEIFGLIDFPWDEMPEDQKLRFFLFGGKIAEIIAPSMPKYVIAIALAWGSGEKYQTFFSIAQKLYPDALDKAVIKQGRGYRVTTFNQPSDAFLWAAGKPEHDTMWDFRLLRRIVEDLNEGKSYHTATSFWQHFGPISFVETEADKYYVFTTDAKSAWFYVQDDEHQVDVVEFSVIEELIKNHQEPFRAATDDEPWQKIWPLCKGDRFGDVQ